MAKIKELKTDFAGVGQVRGFKFTQISQTNKAFLYKIDTGYQIYYEVFKELINERFNCISYPTSKAFGVWAWTTPHLMRAYSILNELSKEQCCVSVIHKSNLPLQLQSALPKEICV